MTPSDDGPAGPWPHTPPHRVEVDPTLQRARADADPQRPRWHVTPPWGWLNDPNGLTVQPGPDGQPLVHLFYQHNSHAPVHDLIEWGHQYSADLVHWQDLPIALEPGPEGPDALGCWSGVIVDDVTAPGGRPVPTMVYSGHNGGPTQVGCLAVPADDDPLMTRWVKDAANPVVAAAPQSVGQDLPEMRDHSVWRENDRWYQVMGSGLPGRGADGAQGGAVLCFSSPDLRRWRYEGALAVGDGDVEGTGTVWECPELGSVRGPGGRRDLLCVSAWHEGETMRSMWMTGHRTGTRMEVEVTGRCDLGENYFYAPQSLTLPDGRRVTIGWMQPNGSQAQLIEAGWAGSMSVPRLVTLAQDGTVRFEPIAQVESLRGQVLASCSGRQVDGVELRSRSLDLVLSGRLGQEPVVLDVLASADGAARTRVVLERAAADRADGAAASGQQAWTGRLSVDRSATTRPGSPWAGQESRLLGGPVPLGADGTFSLRLLLDRSSLEVFVGGQPLSARVLADPADDVVRVRAPQVADARLEAWSMGEAYGQRLEPGAHRP